MGYSLSKEGVSFWRTKPIYRESGNASSLRISQKDGSFYDFSANIKGSFIDLIKLTKGLKNVEDAKKFLDGKGFQNEEKSFDTHPKIKVNKIINLKENLFPNYSFYLKKGISQETLNRYECGVCFSQKMNNRFVFVIRDEDGNIVGLAGRDLYDNGARIKWKLLGDKRFWIYPSWAAEEAERLGYVIIVESIGDMIAVNEAGYWNVVPLFGVALFPKMLNFLSSLKVKKVYVALNNDSGKAENIGQKNAQTVKEKLSKLIESSNIEILTLEKNDFGSCNKEENQLFLQKCIK